MDPVSRYARVLSLIGAATGLASVLFPWWTLRWTWSGGFFVSSVFLYGNRVEGSLAGLGIESLQAVSTDAYDFTWFSLGFIIIAVAGTVFGALRASRIQASLLASTFFYIAGSVVFLGGLSSVLSDQGRTIFSSVTVTFMGSTSTVDSGLSIGFYLNLLAILLVAGSYFSSRRKKVRRGSLC